MSAEQNLSASLRQVTVIEIGDQSGDYCAMMLAGLGAKVIKIEPLEGAPSRKLGPFATVDRDPESSLFFWRYGLNKKSLALDLDHQESGAILTRLAAHADIVLLSGQYLAIRRQLELWRGIAADRPRLILCTITPFGLDGPYRDFTATDLTHLALGGIMAMCGYDAGKDGHYDTPPIAPAMWHSYHIAGEYASIAIMAALHFRDLTGEGQSIDLSINEAVNTCTELSMPIYIHNGEVVRRQTARHAFVNPSPLRLPTSSDGVRMLAAVSPFPREIKSFVRLADECGIEHQLTSAEFAQTERQNPAAAADYRAELVERIVSSRPAQQSFLRAQHHGLPWAPIRRPEENLEDPHFISRHTFASIDHPELARELSYPGTVAGDGAEPHMRYTRRAPRLGGHTHQILLEAGFTPAEVEDLSARKIILDRS